MIALPASCFQSIDCILYIRGMNLASLDLNLLVALDALLAEASVGRAAVRIGLSQPATSHALRRLRDMMGDPLLVRAGARMELTPRAEALRGPLADAMAQLTGLFAPESFDASTSTRRFALMMPDLVADLILPLLMERLDALAPGITLNVRPWRGPAIIGPDFSRSIDIVLSCTGDAYAGFYRQRLYVDKDALAVRKGHPQAARLSTPEGFRAARHVAVVGAGQRDDMIDDWLRREGMDRTISLTVPSYLQALRMASQSDLVAFVPNRLIAAYRESFSLMAVEPPLDPGWDEQFMFYPTRAKADPGSIWLRRVIGGVGRSLDRKPDARRYAPATA
jgi:DNA-binding transcriptional LysR family regulator